MIMKEENKNIIKLFLQSLSWTVWEGGREAALAALAAHAQIIPPLLLQLHLHIPPFSLYAFVKVFLPVSLLVLLQ